MRAKLSIFIIVLTLCAALSAPASAERFYRPLFSFDIPSGWTWEETEGSGENPAYWLYGPNGEAVLLGAEPGKGRSLKQAAEEEWADLKEWVTGPLVKLDENLYTFPINEATSLGDSRVLVGRIKKTGVIFYMLSSVKHTEAADRLYRTVRVGE